MAELPGVADMFAGQSVFVTGGSGFMGKVLVEKLLRSCPDIGTVFLLLRPKRGRSVQERLQDILNTPLFAPLLGRSPEVARKVCAVAGDCAELRLGLSREDEARLQEEVAFVFHLSATVRFDAPLRDAILLNVRGTREVAELAKGMPRLKALQYVSSATIYPRAPELEEQVYYPGYDWKILIKVAETTDCETVNAFSEKIIDWYVLTYPFSKCVAENVIDAYRHDIPVCIFRPGLVTASLQEPFAGWVDNLNGMVGIIAAVSVGLVRAVHVDPSVSLPTTFVDWAVRGMLLTSWATAMDLPLTLDSHHAKVVNMMHKGHVHSIQEMVDGCLLECHNMPYHVRYPRATACSSLLVCWLTCIFSEFTYSLAFDAVSRCIGSKRRLLDVHRKSVVFVRISKFFAFTRLTMKMENLGIIEKLLPGKDFAAFSSRLNFQNSLKYDMHTFFSNSVKGITKYVFKEAVDTTKAKKRLQILFALEVVTFVVLAVLFSEILILWTPIPDTVLQAAVSLRNVTATATLLTNVIIG